MSGCAATVAAVVAALSAPAAGAVGPDLPPFGLGDFDRSEPISITAEQLEAQDVAGRRTLAFRRNVKVKQGPLTLSSALLSAEYVDGEDQPRRLEARGNVRITEGARRAQCDAAIYERRARRITCLGDPARLWDAEDQLAGREVRFDLEGRSVRVEGGTRVEIHRDLAESGLEELGELEGAEIGERLRDGGPVTIAAKSLEADDSGDSRRIRFEGGVVLRQGEIELRAGELLALYADEASRPELLLAEGDVVLAEGSREARCDRAEYTLETRRIRCEGNAVLRDRGDRLEGDRIAFDLESRRVDAVGNARLSVQPRPAPETAQ